MLSNTQARHLPGALSSAYSKMTSLNNILNTLARHVARALSSAYSEYLGSLPRALSTPVSRTFSVAIRLKNN